MRRFDYCRIFERSNRTVACGLKSKIYKQKKKNTNFEPIEIGIRAQIRDCRCHYHEREHESVVALASRRFDTRIFAALAAAAARAKAAFTFTKRRRLYSRYTSDCDATSKCGRARALSSFNSLLPDWSQRKTIRLSTCERSIIRGARVRAPAVFARRWRRQRKQRTSRVDCRRAKRRAKCDATRARV